MEATDPVVEKVFDKVYENFVEEIDAIDNGISTQDGEPRYCIVNSKLYSSCSRVNYGMLSLHVCTGMLSLMYSVQVL